VVGKVVRDIKTSAGAQAYNGGLGLCPQLDPGAKPLGRGSGAKPPEAKRIFIING